MNSERWQRIARVFDEAVSLSGEARQAYLDRACGDDSDLRIYVSELLRSSDRATGFLEKPVHDAAGSILSGVDSEDQDETGAEPADDTSGLSTASLPPSGLSHEMLGPYRLLERIGVGGMGEVWRAEQSGPLRRQVAVKVIKSGMDTKHVVARFEAERQALAWMDHPGIARVYDAGETPRGLPFFAMELVAGEPITTYCDRQRLTVPDRIGLFIKVCEAVQHAHQKGIIHRDLKPSNILVSVGDGEPFPKVIDFGVAKATAGRLTEGTLHTHMGMMIGTPEYMSPEQAEMTPAGIDTRADVYSLGVILYELLTGTLPFDFGVLRERGYDEIRRQIREVEPQRPSNRVRTSGERSAELARNRGAVPSRLVSRLSGELDWIVLRAMEKDRMRRYGSPGDLATDLGRHLRNEPVAAGPPGVLYRARKFARRHRLGVSIAAATVIGLVGVAVMTSVQARRIARERDRANREAKASGRVTEFLTGLFRVADPGVAQGQDITARELLDRGADSIRKDLDAEPVIRARLMLTMGSAYTNLGLYGEAEPYLEESVSVLREELGEDDPETLASMHRLAEVYMLGGRFDDAVRVGQKTLELRRRVLGEEDRLTMASADFLGVLYVESGRPLLAIPLLEQNMATRRRVLGADDPEAFESLWPLADANSRLGRYATAASLSREALEYRLRLYGNENLETLECRNLLGDLLFLQGKYQEAEEVLREGLETSRRLYGPEHRVSLQFRAALAASTFLGHGLSEADFSGYHEVLETALRIYGRDHAYTQVVLFGAGMASLFQRRYAEAEDSLREASAFFQRIGPDRYNALWALDEWAVARRRNGKLAEAEATLRHVIDASRRTLGPDHPHTRDSLRHLADVYLDQARDSEAEKLYTEALAVVPAETWDDPRVRSGSLFGIAVIEAGRGDVAKAMDHLEQAVALGFDAPEALARNPRLESLRADPAFRGLESRVKQNSLRPPRSPLP